MHRNASRGAALLAPLACLLGTLASAAPSENAEHLLGRAGYGHDAWTTQRLAKLGWRGYVDEQLDPTSIADPGMKALRNDSAFDAWTMSAEQLRDTFGNGKARKPGEALRQARAGFVLRGLVSRRQLEAVLTEFWFNHFNVHLPAQRLHMLIPYLRDRIQARVFGSFEDLLLGVARSPAMLTYLDNRANFKTGFKRAGQTYGINENYARELMELHTFGLDDQTSVYSQADIIEAARCLTGWTTSGQTASGFQFLARGHDAGAKTILGVAYPAGGGEDEGVRLIRALAQHPRTATFLSAKLVRFLVGAGQADLTKRASAEFMRTRGDLKAVTRLILLSPELRAAKRSKIKRPTQFLFSALRSLDVKPGSGQARLAFLNRIASDCESLGQPLFAVPPPTGWTDAKFSFMNEGTFLEALRAVQRFTLGSTAVTHYRFEPKAGAGSAATVNALLEQVLGKSAVSATTRKALRGYYESLPSSGINPPRRTLALVFTCPEFIRY